MKPLDIGIASWNSPDKLNRTIQCIKQYTGGEWRLFVIDNNSSDPMTREVITRHAEDPRVVPVLLDTNLGYVGAVNKLLDMAETQYVAYVDNDAYIQTNGWNYKLTDILEINHEVAMVFPNGGAYEIKRTGYTEVMWGVGFCWILKKARFQDIGGLDTEIGHQEEADYSLRLRLAGWKLAADKTVKVDHDATSSNSPESRERINNGIINFVNKWNKYFVGPQVTYHSPNVLRWEDWHPNAIYMEEYYKTMLPGLNANPDTTIIDGRDYDLIKVPRYPALYRDRII